MAEVGPVGTIAAGVEGLIEKAEIATQSRYIRTTRNDNANRIG